jgi:hypothetical protein
LQLKLKSLGRCLTFALLVIKLLVGLCHSSGFEKCRKKMNFFFFTFLSKYSLANVASHFFLKYSERKLQICHPDIQGKCRQRFFAVNFRHKTLLQIIAFNSSFSDFLTTKQALKGNFISLSFV